MEVVYLVIGVLVGGILGYLAHRLMSQSVTGMPQGDVDKLNLQINSLSIEKVRIEEKNKFLETRLTEQKTEIGNLQEKFEKEFENLANRIFTQKNNESKTNIAEILNPLKEKISDFEKKVQDVYEKDTRERSSLSEQLKNLKELNKQMTDEAQNLTKALKGDRNIQGAWGEFILESILEKSGLEKGREYLIQQTIKSEDGTNLRPDVIINLPDNKSMVVDSKVSLVAYERYCSCETNDERKIYLNEHNASLRKHIKLLSPKDYQNLYGLQSLDFVLLFIPIEPAFAAAVQGDNTIFNDAFDKNIVIVSPSTLLATLRTIASIWKQEKQNRNALDIAKKSGELYDKFVNFAEDLIKVGKNLNTAQDSYKEAMKKLSEGSGNLVSRSQKLKEMGAKASKNLPQNLVERSDDEEENQLKLINPDSNML